MNGYKPQREVIYITKKDYIKIADIVKLAIIDSQGHLKDHAMDTLIDRLCVMFKDDNKLFDRDRFIKYIRG